MQPFVSIAGRNTKKTTFTLSAQAVEDIAYLTDRFGCSVRALLDTIQGELIHAGRDKKWAKNNYSNLTMEEALSKATELTVKKSWSVSMAAVEGIKRTAQQNDISRNQLLDAAIRIYRQIFTYEHPAAQNDLKKLNQLLNDLTRGKIFEKYGIELHSYLSPLSADIETVPFDQVVDGLIELKEEATSEYERIFGERFTPDE